MVNLINSCSKTSQQAVTYDRSMLSVEVTQKARKIADGEDRLVGADRKTKRIGGVTDAMFTRGERLRGGCRNRRRNRRADPYHFCQSKSAPNDVIAPNDLTCA